MKKFGLNDSEVEQSREKFGKNQLTEQKREGFWRKLLGNFNDPMIKILCVALIINVVFAILGQVAWYESVGIAAAVLLATLVSTFSEYKNENAFKKLQDEASQIKCKVYRNGEIVEISIDDIVVGDCVLLQGGDKVPADGYIVDGTLQVDQSVLNGEAKEFTKTCVPEGYTDDGNTDFSDLHKIFRGSAVCGGNAVMQVTTVGDSTVYGKIASELQEEDDRETPLKLKLGKLAKQISMFGYIGGVAIAVAFLFQRVLIHNAFDAAQLQEYFSNWMNIANDAVEAVMLAVIIIVMAVPEGLPLMIAIVSAQNMGKMLKDNVLVRKVSGIETAGSLNILFSDKTGTITKGQLETIGFIDGECNETKTLAEIPENLRKHVAVGISYNTLAEISGSGEHRKVIGGNMTERALLQYVLDSDIQLNESVEGNIPFTSLNKYSACSVKGDYNGTLLKGAPEKILEKCKYYYDVTGSKKLLKDKLPAIYDKINELADKSIRVLAFATCDGVIKDDCLPEGDYTLVGVAEIKDDVRPESVAAIAEVHAAGVQVVMITGDGKNTAVAIAKEVGLLKNEDDMVLTSAELAQLSDEEVKAIIPKIRVVARALPSDKSRLVKLAQELNLVVGMTGDGVNDSPALKSADVGFAMGGGTEVAKEASEVVVLDDNFSSIQKAILYGRTIFNSIRKFIIFQLTINIAAVLISFICPLLSVETPLTITQILWVNLVMDTLAALAFGGEPALKKYMHEKPKRRDEAIVSPYMWSSIITGCLWTFGLSMVLLFVPFVRDFFRDDPADKYLLTGYFAFFIFTSVFNAFNARTEEFNLFKNISKNKGFLIVIGVIAAVQIIMTYLGNVIFNCYGLNLVEWAVVLVMSISIIPVDLLRKAIVKAISKKKTVKVAEVVTSSNVTEDSETKDDYESKAA
ncbi:MAG: calcium-translocating P-type ATPase, PMCA-type [Clostridia bacterium]|nr:calcium-translocating P-type ATPase, PMCA-type [Clostridia bacterium]